MIYTISNASIRYYRGYTKIYIAVSKDDEEQMKSNSKLKNIRATVWVFVKNCLVSWMFAQSIHDITAES